MSAKVIILFALLGTALAFKTPSEDEENRVSSDESVGGCMANLNSKRMLTYAKLHAEEGKSVCISYMLKRMHMSDSLHLNRIPFKIIMHGCS